MSTISMDNAGALSLVEDEEMGRCRWKAESTRLGRIRIRREDRHLASDEEKPTTTQPGSCQLSDMLHKTWNTTAE